MDRKFRTSDLGNKFGYLSKNSVNEEIPQTKREQVERFVKYSVKCKSLKWKPKEGELANLVRIAWCKDQNRKCTIFNCPIKDKVLHKIAD